MGNFRILDRLARGNKKQNEQLPTVSEAIWIQIIFSVSAWAKVQKLRR
jgi:hypothetical protein